MFKVGDVIKVKRKLGSIYSSNAFIPNQSYEVIDISPIPNPFKIISIKGTIDGRETSQCNDDFELDKEYYRRKKLEKICSNLVK